MYGDGLVSRFPLDPLYLVDEDDDRVRVLGGGASRPLGEVELRHYTTVLRLNGYMKKLTLNHYLVVGQ